MIPRCEPQTEVVYDSPAGLIRASAKVEDGRVTSVAFRQCPRVPLHARARSGDERRSGPSGHFLWRRLLRAGRSRRPRGRDSPRERGHADAAGNGDQARGRRRDRGCPPRGTRAARHLRHDHLRAAANGGRRGTEHHHLRGGAVDRSPCGTGTSAKLACLYADGRVARGQPYVHESVIGTTFTGRVLGETAVGPYPAVETEIAGRGFLTGFQQFVVDPEDATAGGFLVR